jgi:hypothetical protein
MRKWIMNILLELPGFLLAGSGKIVDGSEYELTIIEEGPVPLADGLQNSTELYFLTFLILFLFLFLALLLAYIMSCSRFRRRIRELEEVVHQEKSELGWNLIRLREKIASLENQMLEKCG